MPQQGFCRIQFIIGQRLTHRRTADAYAAWAEGHRAGDVKTIFRASLL